MFDEVPVQVWILLAIAAAAYEPAHYLYEYVMHSPSRRDVTQPKEDTSWRTPRQLFRSLVILAAMLALVVFIFTPAAAHFARSPAFVPTLLACFGVWSLYTVLAGFMAGRIQPFIRGLNDTYERAAQPKRFWASLAWNAFFGGACIWLALEDYRQAPIEALEERCYNENTAYSPQQAMVACNKLLLSADDPPRDRADYMHSRGIAYHRLGEYVHAVADYSEAARLDPGEYHPHYNRGLAYRELGDIPRAFSDFTEAIRIRPDDADAYVERGLIFLEAGRLDEALADFTWSHDLDRNDPWPIANRGLTYAWKKDRERAEKDFAAVRVLDPANPVMLRGEAVIRMNSGDLPGAVDRLTASMGRDPDNLWALRTRSELYYELGEFEKSRQDDSRWLQLSRTRAIRRD